MLTMSYFSLLVNYYLYYYINHSRFWPILSRDLLRNKILQKRINNEKVTLLFTGVQIITSNSIKLDFWSTPKGRFSMRWYIGVCWNMPRHVPTLRCDLRASPIVKAHTDCTDFTWLSLWVRNLTDGQTLPNPPLGRAYQLLNRLNKKDDSTKVGMREFDFVRVLICGNLC